ncbi:sigma-70 family RNA polymerase sigma factor [Prauserella rugosa]|uniref:RNA polymerase sigma factor n=1 Tax=Prauserella rugosa TaxID=43354 RepID=A0A660C6B3_9PSEU|nr:sigma-70 family RNA polymerase sigma factor [Prauserella rugosa]KMS86798.1 RNA polymerase sigma factor SigB [Streptomyces regensis]TWH19048.1 RNA polymerase nonessential primary-like sigma factor [Prauserella rugosa]
MTVQTLEREASGTREHNAAMPTVDTVTAVEPTAAEEAAPVTATPTAVVEDLDAQGPSADLVRVYLNGIGKTALLSAAEEVDLAKRIEAGVYAQHLLDTAEDLSDERRWELRMVARDGRRAKNHLLQANLRLVVSLAKRYTGRGMPLLDLIQEGNLGLIRAVEKFDYAKGFKFSTYATWWIRQAITRGMADQGRTIRLPVHLVEQVNKLARIKRDLHQKHGREATNEELAAESGIAVEKVANLLDHARDPVSLDMPVGNEEDAPLGDFIEDSEAADAESSVIAGLLHDDMRRVLGTLDEREQNVIRMRYGLDDGQPRTLDQIGRHFGLSRERVRQIEREVMTKLRQGERADKLRAYAS